jgi:hypothetical protein
VNAGKIAADVALEKASDKESFRRAMGKKLTDSGI